MMVLMYYYFILKIITERGIQKSVVSRMYSDRTNSFFNFIPHAPDSFYILWVFSGIFHFFSKVANVNHNGIVTAGVIFFTPHFIKQSV